jgi:hypothetical protein
MHMGDIAFETHDDIIDFIDENLVNDLEIINKTTTTTTNNNNRVITSIYNSNNQTNLNSHISNAITTSGMFFFLEKSGNDLNFFSINVINSIFFLFF